MAAGGWCADERVDRGGARADRCRGRPPAPGRRRGRGSEELEVDRRALPLVECGRERRLRRDRCPSISSRTSGCRPLCRVSRAQRRRAARRARHAPRGRTRSTSGRAGCSVVSSSAVARTAGMAFSFVMTCQSAENQLAFAELGALEPVLARLGPGRPAACGRRRWPPRRRAQKLGPLEGRGLELLVSDALRWRSSSTSRSNVVVVLEFVDVEPSVVLDVARDLRGARRVRRIADSS